MLSHEVEACNETWIMVVCWFVLYAWSWGSLFLNTDVDILWRSQHILETPCVSFKQPLPMDYLYMKRFASSETFNVVLKIAGII